MPTFGNVDLGHLLADGSDDLACYLLDRHHPEEPFAFGHCCIDEARTDVGDMNMVAALISLLAQGFHVVNLIGFRCTVGGSHRLAAQSTSRGDGDEVTVALLLENVVKCIDNERPAHDVGVDSRTLHSVVQRGIDVTRSRTNDSEVYVFQFGIEDIDGSRYFVLLGDVSRGCDCRVGMLLVQFQADVFACLRCRCGYRWWHIFRRVPCQCQRSLR